MSVLYNFIIRETYKPNSHVQVLQRPIFTDGPKKHQTKDKTRAGRGVGSYWVDIAGWSVVEAGDRVRPQRGAPGTAL